MARPSSAAKWASQVKCVVANLELRLLEAKKLGFQRRSAASELEPPH